MESQEGISVKEVENIDTVSISSELNKSSCVGLFHSLILNVDKICSPRESLWYLIR